MLTVHFVGKDAPPIEGQEEKIKGLYEWLGIFKEEADAYEMVFIFYCPPSEGEKEISFSFKNGNSTHDFVRRFNHYKETGEYIQP